MRISPPRARVLSWPVVLVLAAAVPTALSGPPVAEAPRAEAIPTGKPVAWEPSLATALVRAEKEQRPLLLSLGAVGEARSEALDKELYGNRKLSPCFEQSINVAAWSFLEGEERKLPDFGDTEPEHHGDNWALAMERWLRPNAKGVIALPQHLWLSPQGEVLVSCPWELSAEEFSWCADQALRRIGEGERPELLKEARPPRRLLLAEVVQLLDDDERGRGLKPDELEQLLKSKRKGYLTGGDAKDVARILFTDDQDAIDYMMGQMGLWEFGGDALANIINGTYSLMGLVCPASYVELLEKFAGHNRASTRAAIAAALEQIGHRDGLSVVKKALKKERDDAARAEWVRALGACGRGDKGVAKMLIKLAQKEKHGRVRVNAILGLGHVLPEKGAYEFLTELCTSAEGEERQAAILALALGRATAAEELLEGLKGPAVFGETGEVLEKSLEVLAGGNLYLIESAVRRVSGSSIGRQRLFFRGVAKVPDIDLGG
ncbi:MAG: HEAT repeat domain-containing protein [Planctomycetota bacterium]|jgi:hypothetical protein|nr:HEAT repeat domain-containing protein [Planctomycetota bacterium]